MTPPPSTRAICPRCRRSYEGSQRTCTIDGAILLGEEAFVDARPPSQPTRSDRPRPSGPISRTFQPLRSPSFAPREPTGSSRTSQTGLRRPSDTNLRRYLDPPPSRGPGLPPSLPALGPPPGSSSPSLDPRDPRDPREGRRPTGGHAPIEGAGFTPPPLPQSRPARGEASSSGAPVERLGPYRLIRQLGEGGMARIYLAEHEQGQRCAIKRLHADHFSDRLTVARFLAEARAVGAINHPNLVAAYDVVEEPTEIYLVLEFLEGRDAAQVLRREGPMSAERVASIMAQACDGLAAVHGHNIIHRDLKPENIFLTTDDHGREQVKLLDFGVARLIGDRPQELKTRSGLTVGTPTYMSPEQATASAIDPRSDIYTVGVVMYELLVGAPPFTGAGYGDVMLMHVNDPAPRVSLRRPNVPPWIEQIVMRCLEKDPAARFQSAAELAGALRRAGTEPLPPVRLEGRGSSRRTDPSTTTTSSSRRASWPWVVGVLAGVAVVVAAGVLLLLGPSPDDGATAVRAPVLTAASEPEPPPPPARSPPVSPGPALAPAASVAAVAAPAPTPAPPRLTQRGASTVMVQTRPRHARVTLVGLGGCVSPCSVVVPPGEGLVELRVSARGYAPQTRTIDGLSPPRRLRVVLSRASRAPGRAARPPASGSDAVN